MPNFKLTFILFFCCPNIALAQNDCGHGESYAELNTNNIRAGVLQSGALWWDGSDGRYIAPIDGVNGEEVTAIFAGGLWLGGTVNGEVRTAAATYGHGAGNREDFFPGPLDAATGAAIEGACFNWDRHFVITDTAVKNHQEDFAANGAITVPDSAVFGWPGKDNPHFLEYGGFALPVGQDLAPFVDTNADGIYDPAAGDYPDIKGDQMIWWVFNDAANIHTQSYGESIGMEIHAAAYAFQSFEPAINNTTFYDFKYIYRGTEPLDDFTAAIWTDVDLGCFTDDYIGVDSTRSLAYYYNRDEIDGTLEQICENGIPTYGEDVPLLGMKLISDSENIGVTSFGYYLITFGSPSLSLFGPTNPVEYFHYMNGRWRDGQPLIIGGDGYGFDNDIPTKFAFPGNPISPEEWSMCTSATENNTEDNRNTILSSAGGTLNPNETREFTYAVIFVPDIPHPCPDIAPLQEAADIVQNFDCTVSSVQESTTSATEISLYPNPASENLTVILSDNTDAVTEYSVLDAAGRVLITTSVPESSHLFLPLNNLKTGLYFLSVKTRSGRVICRKFTHL